MYTAHIAGTRKEISKKLKDLAIPATQSSPEAVREFVIGHVPMLIDIRWQVTISCESIHNPSWEAIAGHLTVTVQKA